MISHISVLMIDFPYFHPDLLNKLPLLLLVSHLIHGICTIVTLKCMPPDSLEVRFCIINVFVITFNIANIISVYSVCSLMNAVLQYNEKEGNCCKFNIEPPTSHTHK